MSPSLRSRVYEHGEVFTPPAVVNRMLEHVREQLAAYETRVLEPACGSGNFLAPILSKKLENVDLLHSSSEAERFTKGLHAVMSTYGIELLEDNVSDCRDRLLSQLERWANNQELRALTDQQPENARLRAALRQFDKQLVSNLGSLGFTPSDRSRLGLVQVKTRTKLQDIWRQKHNETAPFWKPVAHALKVGQSRPQSRYRMRNG
jgi:hypothetical protein